MYGIVNKAIEDMIVANFGQQKWDLIKERSGVEIDFFISNEPYDDDITYSLATAVSEEMNMPIETVLSAFGEWWILKTGKEKYGSLMAAGGDNFKEFMTNLPMFHNRVMLIYPKLTPPEFKVTDVTEHSLNLHYHSKRHGLQAFVKGLILGLGKLYKTPIAIELLQSRSDGDTHEIFKVSWS